MDPLKNPYAPGAGTHPPELVGRDGLITQAKVALQRIRAQQTEKSLVFHGLRGVGKTVLLNHICRQAEDDGIACVKIEASEERSLPALLAPALRAALLQLDRGAALRDKVSKGMRVLASFVQAVSLRYQDVVVNINVDPELGLADSGDLGVDLKDLFIVLGEAAKERKTVIVLFIDELQYVPKDQLAALIAALHSVTQAQLPIMMLAAGLPQLVGNAGQAKSYAERLFTFASIDSLNDDDARKAIVIPAKRKDVDYTSEAINEILSHTRGYPYFLQEWGKHSWTVAPASPINLDNARDATDAALRDLDAGFFRVRFDRLTPAEKRYIRAMAELGPGPHRSGNIGQALEKTVTQVASTRDTLIHKGMLYSPAHGDTAFTVPLFDGFMKRIMPSAA